MFKSVLDLKKKLASCYLNKNLILIYVLSFFFILDIGLAPLCLTVRLLEFA